MKKLFDVGHIITIVTLLLTVGVLYGRIEAKIAPVDLLRDQIIELKIEMAKMTVTMQELRETIKSAKGR